VGFKENFLKKGWSLSTNLLFSLFPYLENLFGEAMTCFHFVVLLVFAGSRLATNLTDATQRQGM